MRILFWIILQKSLLVSQLYHLYRSLLRENSLETLSLKTLLVSYPSFYKF